jgi:hypothetical protein
MIDMPLVIGGRATFRITTPLGPAAGVSVSAAPNVPTPLPSPFPFRGAPSGCRGVTDRDGRVTLANFPPGPAHVDVHMINSTYIRQVDVPFDGRDVAITIPDGFLPVRVVNDKAEPVPGALITWTGGGGRVEATAMATGDALLESVGTASGTLMASAPRYQPAEQSLAEPPGILQTLTLSPLPAPERVRVRVMTVAGEPVPNAMVEFVPTDSAAVPRVALTDAGGAVSFGDVLSPSGQVIVSADGFAASTARVATGVSDVVCTLSPGYRAIVDVQLPTTAGPRLVRVLDDSNRSMDDALDGASDRRVDPPGRLSLGPLAPGTYVIELQGLDGPRTERVRIADRDVHATVR